MSQGLAKSELQPRFQVIADLHKDGMSMRNINRHLNSRLPETAPWQALGMRPRKWILGLSLAAALLSWGCPKQDPLQAFSPPATPIDQGPAPVPEPATALLFGAALLIGGAIARRRRKGAKTNHSR
jgi:hypothetical protein